MRRVFLLLALVALSAASRSIAGTADCPTSTISLSGWVPISTTAAAFDTGYGATYHADPASWRVRGYFDLGRDTLGVLVRPEYGFASSQIYAAERFMLVGPPAGTPIPFMLGMPIKAALDVSSTIDVWTRANGTVKLELDGAVLAEASEERRCDDYYGCSGNGNLTTTLSSAVQIPSGQEFVVAFDLRAGVSGNYPTPGSSRIEASFQFVDLPPGVTVISCHEAEPTPAARTTWGTLKLRYR